MDASAAAETMSTTTTMSTTLNTWRYWLMTSSEKVTVETPVISCRRAETVART